MVAVSFEHLEKNIKRHKNYSKTYSKIHIDKMKMSNTDMIHIEKTPSSILDYLLDEGIAKRNCDGPWINMNERDANIYMATLARYLAKIHGNVEIGTDNCRKFLYPYIPEKSKKKVGNNSFIEKNYLLCFKYCECSTGFICIVFCTSTVTDCYVVYSFNSGFY